MPKQATAKNSTIICPVANDGWLPDFRCGEFAIVDTADREPREDVFFALRGSKENLNIVKLVKFDKSQGRIIGKGSRSPHWSIMYPAQIAQRMDGSPAPDIGDHGRFHMMDGPLREKFIDIVGRVVGVLGDQGVRSFEAK